MRLPMFPLGGVLLPGEVLPLHVFEPRYRALVADCLAAPSPDFGVVLIERGSEVGGGDVRFDAGCLSRIVEAAQMPDGRWALAVVGVERIRVGGWLPDDPYPVADVEPWPDDDQQVDAERVDAVLVHLRRVLAMAAEAGDLVAPVPEAADDPWRLASMAPIGPLDRLSILRAAGPSERLDRLAEALGDAEAVLAARLDGG